MLNHARRLAEIRLNRPPRAYRPGALLQRLQGDLLPFDFELLALDRAHVRAADLEFEVQEVVEPQFLMHVVSSEFSCEFPTNDSRSTARISARHRGAWRRTGVEFVSAAGVDGDLIERLTNCAFLQAALKELDFTQWQLQRRESGWRLTMRHFGASEVVGHMPAFRRYVRLGVAQRDALVSTMRALGSLLK